MRFKLIIFILLIVLFTIFVVQNTEPINMQIFFWRVEQLPKIILLIVTLTLGIVLGIISSAFFNRKKHNKLTASKLKKNNETEIL